MTRMMCAWRQANAYMRSGEHAKAIYWLSRTLAILDNERPRRLASQAWIPTICLPLYSSQS